MKKSNKNRSKLADKFVDITENNEDKSDYNTEKIPSSFFKDSKNLSVER